MASAFDHASLTTLHIACAILTYSFFLTRGVLMLTNPPALRARWARIVPPVVDTVLLAAAIGMLVIARINPLKAPWLVAKIIGLLLLHRPRHHGAEARQDAARASDRLHARADRAALHRRGRVRKESVAVLTLRTRSERMPTATRPFPAFRSR